MHDHVPDRLPGPGWPDVGLGRGTADLAPAAPDPDRVARPMAPGPAHATRRDGARHPAGHQRLTKRAASITSSELLGAVGRRPGPGDRPEERARRLVQTAARRPECHFRTPLPSP